MHADTHVRKCPTPEVNWCGCWEPNGGLCRSNEGSYNVVLIVCGMKTYLNMIIFTDLKMGIYYVIYAHTYMKTRYNSWEFVLSFCHGFSGSNSGCQACIKSVLPTELSH